MKNKAVERCLESLYANSRLPNMQKVCEEQSPFVFQSGNTLENKVANVGECMKPLVCIAMEIKAREFDALLYLAARCVQAGFPVLFGPRSRVWRFFRKDAGAMPLYYVAKELWHIEDVITPGMKLFTLDEEGGGTYSFDGEIRTHCVDMQDSIERMFTWGQAHKDFLEKKGGAINKINVTGHPRFDIKKKFFAPYFQGISSQIGKPSKYVMIGSNYVTANPLFGWDWYKGHLRSIYGDDFDFTGVETQRAAEEEGMYKLVNLAREIVAQYEDVHVIWRPHPVESDKGYSDLFSNDERIHVVKEGNAHEWILDAEAYVHPDCTTGIEAFFSEKEVICYGAAGEVKKTCPIIVSEVATTLDQAMSLVGKAISNGGVNTLKSEDYQKRLNTIKPVIANTDFDSASKIANLLFETWEKEGEVGFPLPKPKSWLYRTAKKARRILRGNRINDLDKLVKNKMPGISLTEVNRRIELLSMVVPELSNIKVSEFDIDSFLLWAE